MRNTRRRADVLACSPLLLLAVATGARAQAVPYAAWVRSVQVLRPELAAFSAPDDHAPRRGTILLGARLPVMARVPGAGCGNGAFVQVFEQAFVCERDVAPSAAEPDAFGPGPGEADADAPAADLPHEYLQAGREGIRAYAGLDDVKTDDYATVLGKGFTVAVAAHVQRDGVSFVRTLGGYYVPSRSLRAMRGSSFAGVAIAADEFAHLAWVVRDAAEVREAPGGATLRRAQRLQRLELAPDAAGAWLPLREGGVVASRDVVRPALAKPPATITDDERWVDVDVARQVLVAYEGARPVFATLVSTGVEARRETRTPRGEFRIWVKLRESDMRESDRFTLEQSYAVEHVPWVQFFDKGYALHAAFWHDRFGEPHSRGCVNLSPRDARWLFDFTRPELPPGWLAVRPVEQQEPATLVVVH